MMEQLARLCPLANWSEPLERPCGAGILPQSTFVTLGFPPERVSGIEPAMSAWEAGQYGLSSRRYPSHAALPR